MNDIFINKLKKAINNSHPIESINELISEYEELKRLAKWKDEIISSGNDYEKHKTELNRITKILEKNGYYDSIIIDKIDQDLRNFFKKLK